MTMLARLFTSSRFSADQIISSQHPPSMIAACQLPSGFQGAAACIDSKATVLKQRDYNLLTQQALLWKDQGTVKQSDWLPTDQTMIDFNLVSLSCIRGLLKTHSFVSMPYKYVAAQTAAWPQLFLVICDTAA